MQLIRRFSHSRSHHTHTPPPPHIALRLSFESLVESLVVSCRVVLLTSLSRSLIVFSFVVVFVQEGFEGAITEQNIEIAVVGSDKKFRVLSEQEVRDYVKEVE